jgi:hypothetical protein
MKGAPALAMAAELDHYRLEEIARHHPISAAVFVPFVVVRLRGESEATEATLTVRLVDVPDPGETRRTLRLWWSADTVPDRPPAVQSRTVTEWAACGLACVVISLYAGLRVREVSGDVFHGGV